MGLHQRAINIFNKKVNPDLTQQGVIANELPAVTAADNGKVLKVANGAWGKGDDNGLPTATSEDKEKVLTVGNNGVWTMAEPVKIVGITNTEGALTCSIGATQVGGYKNVVVFLRENDKILYYTLIERDPVTATASATFERITFSNNVMTVDRLVLGVYDSETEAAPVTRTTNSYTLTPAST